MKLDLAVRSACLGLGLFLSLSACKTTDPGSENGSEDDGSETVDDGITTATATDSASGDGDGDTPPTTDSDTTDSDTTDSETDGTDSDTTGTPSECGNGELEPGEGCDDGNTVSGDGCSATCFPEGPQECNGQIYQCGDEIDNDDDGLIDLSDFECISPCDDDESTFKTNLPGQNNDCKGDCYWDSNSGSGDDKCEWNLICDPANPGAEIGCEYDPNFNMCEMTQMQDCLDFCTPVIPNGCDCFGCCQIGDEFYYLDGAECALDNLDGCQQCTFNEDCNNPCEPELCELCFGQDPSELPDECNEPECPDGIQSCTDSSQCEEGFFCLTGCCIPVDIG